MDNNRLTKCVFDIDYYAPGKTWRSEVKSILDHVNMQQYFENKRIVNLRHVENILGTTYQRDWNEKLHTVSKLRTYVIFKSTYKVERYLKLNIAQNERSHLAQFRCAVLPLKIETGRFSGLAIGDRLCQVCDQHTVESETHFLLHCNVYDDLRRVMFDKSERRDNSFITMNDSEKLKFILTHEERECARYLVKAMSRRKSLLYNS